MKAFDRVCKLIGDNNAKILNRSTVAVFGVGGVGGFAVEALSRSGIGKFILVDSDVVEESNINRQIIANVNSVGELKVDVMKERILSINPDAEIKTYPIFYLPENASEVDLTDVDYVVDAVDTVTAKVHIIKSATEKNLPVISCMGTAGKMDVTALKVDKIEKTTVCPLAKVMRKELKKLNITGIDAVYSTEESSAEVIVDGGKRTPPSMIFVPAAAGLMLAQKVIQNLIKEEKQ